MKQRILFVCLGNICRSPAAEAMMRMLIERNNLTDSVILDSAGTYGGHSGERSDARMRRAAEARGIPMTHRARQVKEEDFEHFDMLIAMDDNNYENLFRLAPNRDYHSKIYRFREFLRKHTEWSYIPDPYYEGQEGFELVLDLLEDSCSTLIELLKSDNH